MEYKDIEELDTMFAENAISDDTIIEPSDNNDYSHIYDKPESKENTKNTKSESENYVKDIINLVKSNAEKSPRVDFDNLEDFLMTLSPVEQKKWRDYAKRQHIYGNPILETMLILNFGAHIQASRFQNFMENMKKTEEKHLMNLEESFEEEAEIKLAEFTSSIEKLIDKVNNITLAVEEYQDRKKQESIVELEKHMSELRVKLDSEYKKELIRQKEKLATPIANAVKSIPQTLDGALDKHLAKIENSFIGANQFKVIMFSMMGSIAGSTAMIFILKFFNFI